MGFRQLLTGALIGFVSCGAIAQSEWEYVSIIKGVQIAVDKNSISKAYGDSSQATHKVWIRHLIDEDLEQDGLAVGDYRMSLMLVNCDNRTMGTKSVTVYKNLKNGVRDAKSASHPYVKMKDVVPNTVGATIVDIVCST